MPAITTDFGEEWAFVSNLTTVTPDVLLYNQTTDGIGETSDVSDITSEPNGASYARATGISVSGFDNGGNYAIQNDNTLSFDTSDSTNTVDHAGVVDSVGGTDRLVFVAPLNDSRDLNNFSEITIEPGLLTFTGD